MNRLSSFYKNKAKSCLFTARHEIKAKTYHFLQQKKKSSHRKTFLPPKINYNNSNDDYTVKQKEKIQL